MKKIIGIGMAVLLCATLLAGCGERKEKPAAGGLLEGSGAKAGAAVTFSHDEQGNRTYQYTNPDGSGGGGVEIE